MTNRGPTRQMQSAPVRAAVGNCRLVTVNNIRLRPPPCPLQRSVAGARPAGSNLFATLDNHRRILYWPRSLRAVMICIKTNHMGWRIE